MTTTQQVLLRDAMRRLDMTRDVFAERIGSRRRALDSWLLPDESSEFRAMPEVARRFVQEILAHVPREPASTQSVQSALPASVPGTGPLRHLLSVDQFSRESVEDLLHRLADVMLPIARRQKVTRGAGRRGAGLNLFFEASIADTGQLSARRSAGSGAWSAYTTGFTFSVELAKGEVDPHDTSRVISGYVDAIVVRHPEQGAVAEFARATNVPVVNGR